MTLLKNKKIRPFYPIGVDEDDIWVFIDKDGRTMKVVGTKDGPAKVAF